MYSLRIAFPWPSCSSDDVYHEIDPLGTDMSSTLTYYTINNDIRFHISDVSLIILYLHHSHPLLQHHHKSPIFSAVLSTSKVALFSHAYTAFSNSLLGLFIQSLGSMLPITRQRYMYWTKYLEPRIVDWKKSLKPKPQCAIALSFSWPWQPLLT